MPKPKAKPQFDDAPLADDDEEGACPIPDEHGEVVLHRKSTKEGTKRGKSKTGTGKKPSR